MPTFEITTAQGHVYEVDAENETAAGAALTKFLGSARAQLEDRPAELSPDTFVGPEQSYFGDVRQALGSIPQYAAAGIAGLPGSIESMFRDKPSLPTIGGLQQRMNAYEPQTLPGKIVRGAAEGLPLAPLGIGGLGAKIAQATIPPIASELAGAATEGTTAEPWARGAAGLGTGLGLGMRAASAPGRTALASAQQAGRITPQELTSAGARQFQDIREFGPAVPSLRGFAGQAKAALAESFDEGLAPGVFSSLTKLEKTGGPAATAAEVVNFRTLLGKYTKETQDFKPTAQAAAATQTKAMLDDWIEQVDPKLAAQISRASRDYRGGELGRTIANKEARATYGASSTASGLNTQNLIRQQLRSIVTNPAQLKRFDPATQELMKQAVAGSTSENVLRWLSNIGGGGGGLGAVLTGAVGGHFAGPGGILAPAVGLGLKMGLNRQALKKLDEISKSAMASSPTARVKAAAAKPRIEAAREAIRKSRMPAAARAAMLQALELQ